MLDASVMRPRIVAEALSWVGTPYKSNAMVKGPGGGTDCAMLLAAVYGELGLLPEYHDPRPYAPYWHVHRQEELYMQVVLKYAHEIQGLPLPGDVVMFQIGRLYAHGAIVIQWPLVVHAVGNSCVVPEDISKSTVGKRALAVVPKRYFSLWEP
jgi:cell wall-associated NlpC family hydrolase